jgi:hypothetical protein
MHKTLDELKNVTTSSTLLRIGIPINEQIARAQKALDILKEIENRHNLRDLKKHG